MNFEYVDLDTMDICSHVFLQRKHSTYKNSEFTEEELAAIRAAPFVEPLEKGDIRTGKAVLVDGAYVREFINYTSEQLAQQEQAWVKAEMEIADEQVKKFDDGHDRTMGASVQRWRAYRNQLRDRVQGGVIVGEARPGRPG